MEGKELTLRELKAMKKPKLVELATHLKLNIRELNTKKKLYDALILALHLSTEGSESEELLGSPRGKHMENWQFQLEIQKLQFERDVRMAQIELEKEHHDREKEREDREIQFKLQMAQMEHEREMEQLKRTPVPAQQAPQVQQFRVQEAAKLLPQLVNEQDIESYIISFEKIAEVNK